MKIEISIEKGKEKEDDMESHMEKPMSEKEYTPFELKVSKMLAKMAGRKKPNQIDLEAARDFAEDDAEFKAGMED